jgi:hypothetical protein
VVLHCVRGELNRSPAFGDSGVDVRLRPLQRDETGQSGLCKQCRLAELTGLLSPAVDPIESSAVQAQHLSSSSGGVDADNVTTQSQPGQAVFSLGAANDRTLEKCSLLALQRVLDATITFSDLALELVTFGLR